MAVLMESPWYRQILQQGEKIGEKKGLLVGISTGLEFKFGTEGLQLMSEIEALESLETIEAILKVMKTVKTIDELRRVYRS